MDSPHYLYRYRPMKQSSKGPIQAVYIFSGAILLYARGRVFLSLYSIYVFPYNHNVRMFRSILTAFSIFVMRGSFLFRKKSSYGLCSGFMTEILKCLNIFACSCVPICLVEIFPNTCKDISYILQGLMISVKVFFRPTFWKSCPSNTDKYYLWGNDCVVSQKSHP